MKMLSHKLYMPGSESWTFTAYRWFTLFVAAFAVLLLPQASQQAMWFGLLLLAIVLTIVQVAVSQTYVRLARQRPLVLVLDMVAGLGLVWLSGGALLPFLPFAWGALLLPVLLFGWRGAALAGLIFGFADYTVLIFAGVPNTTDTTMQLTRISSPLLIALVFWVGWLLPQWVLAMLEAPVASGLKMPRWYPAPPTPPAGNTGMPSLLSRQNRPRQGDPPPTPSVTTLQTERLADAHNSTAKMNIRAASNARGYAPRTDTRTLRRIIYENVSVAPDASLETTLHQLTRNFNRYSAVNLELHTLGSARRLSYARYLMLLRLTEEALLNVEQHARAHSASLTLYYQPREVTVMIADDGVGLLDGTYARPGLHSLRAVEYCLLEWDGYLQVFEGQHGGVVVRAGVPLDQE